MVGIDQLVAPITTAFSQQFKEMFSTLNEYISASIPSIQYFKSVTESFKIQETLARSSLDYSKALTFLENQLNRTEGSRLENMKEVVANFDSGIRATGDELLSLQSELRRTGVDTQLSRKVFTDLYGMTGGSVKAQDQLARSLRETSKNQLVSINSLVKALDAISEEMQINSIIANDPARAERITNAMAGMAIALPENMRSELLKFIISTDQYSNRLMTGTEEIVQAIKTESDVAKLPGLLEQLYSKLGSSLDTLTGGTSEFVKTRILENLNLKTLYAAQQTVQNLTEQQKITGPGADDAFAKFTADANAVDKTMKSVIEEERRKSNNNLDELTGMKDAIQLTTGALKGLGTVTEALAPAFDLIAEGLKRVVPQVQAQQNFQNANFALKDPELLENYTKVIEELNKGKKDIVSLNEQYSAGAINLQSFNAEMDTLLRSLRSKEGSPIVDAGKDIELALTILDENLLKSSDSLGQFINDIKDQKINFVFSNLDDEAKFFNQLNKRNIRLNEDQTNQFKNLFEETNKKFKKIEKTNEGQDQFTEKAKLERNVEIDVIAKLNVLLASMLNARKNIDEDSERKNLSNSLKKDLSDTLERFINLTTESQRTQKLNSDNVERITNVLRSHAILLEGIMKVPAVGDNTLIGVGQGLTSMREPQ